jgi:hypothetical protein
MKNDIIELKKFEVVCKCGHVGISHYIAVPFPVKAQSGKEAARIARQYPRVKHDHKYAILSVLKIDQNRFDELEENLKKDAYMHCSCIQDQNMIDISDRLQDEEEKELYLTKKNENGKLFYCCKKIIRNPKKYMNHYHYYGVERYNDIA